jgi:hypothetical protein
LVAGLGRRGPALVDRADVGAVGVGAHHDLGGHPGKATTPPSSDATRTEIPTCVRVIVHVHFRLAYRRRGRPTSSKQQGVRHAPGTVSVDTTRTVLGRSRGLFKRGINQEGRNEISELRPVQNPEDQRPAPNGTGSMTSLFISVPFSSRLISSLI